MKLFIATPCYRRIEPRLAVQWAQHVAAECKIDVLVGTESDCPWIDLAYETLVATFLASPCEWVLFREDDVHVGASVVWRMLAATTPENRLIVAPYPKRKLGPDGRPVWIRHGFGMTMVHREVFIALAKAFPELRYLYEGCEHLAVYDPLYVAVHGPPARFAKLRTDEAFFRRARKVGFSPFELDDFEVAHAGLVARFLRAAVEGTATPEATPAVTPAARRQKDEGPEAGGAPRPTLPSAVTPNGRESTPPDA